jgi:lipoate synthase
VVETYWESPKAKKLFLGNVNDEQNVVKVIKEWIERLQQVNKTVDGWKDIVDKHGIDNLCSEGFCPYFKTKVLETITVFVVSPRLLI